MTRNGTDRSVNPGLLLSGAVLIAAGSLLGAIGFALGGAALAGAGRRWQQGTGMTSRQIAKHAVTTVRVATTAGSDAWHQPMPQRSVRSADNGSMSEGQMSRASSTT